MSSRQVSDCSIHVLGATPGAAWRMIGSGEMPATPRELRSRLGSDRSAIDTDPPAGSPMQTPVAVPWASAQGSAAVAGVARSSPSPRMTPPSLPT
jgi:hypothetical protein